MGSPSAGLRQVIIRGLFGVRDYDISLDTTLPTVLTGANGTGKSTLLRLIHAASIGDVNVLANSPLQRFELHFDDLPPLLLRRDDLDRITLRWDDHESEVSRWDIPTDLPNWAREVLTSTAALSAAEMTEVLTSAAIQADVTATEFRNITARIGRPSAPSAPDWLGDFSRVFPVVFVTDQRLVTEPKPAGDARRVRQQARQPARKPARCRGCLTASRNMSLISQVMKHWSKSRSDL